MCSKWVLYTSKSLGKYVAMLVKRRELINPRGCCFVLHTHTHNFTIASSYSLLQLGREAVLKVLSFFRKGEGRLAVAKTQPVSLA